MFCSGSSTSSSADDGIAPPVVAELVDFIQHEDRVVGAGPTNRLDDAARHRADVGAAVSADFRLVAHAAERHPGQLSSQRPCDRLRQTRFADARRPDEAEDRLAVEFGGAALAFGGGHLPLQLAHRQVLENAVLDLLQIVVILVQDLARLGHVDLAFGALVPGQRRQPVEVGLDHPVLSGGGWQLAQAVELAPGLLGGLLRHAGLFDLGAELADFGLGLAAFAKLALDRLQLLAQVVLALVLAKLFLDVGLDLLAKLEDVEFLGDEGVELGQLLPDRIELEQLLPLFASIRRFVATR